MIKPLATDRAGDAAVLRRKVTSGALTAVMALSAATLCLALPSSAAVEEDPLWYFNMLGYQAIHDSGITGEGVVIAVIDTPLYPDVPTLQGTDLRPQDSFCLDEQGALRASTSTDVDLTRHGTNVVSYLIGTGAGYDGQTGVKGVAPGATVLYFPLHDNSDTTICSFDTGPVSDGGSDEQEFALAMEAAVASGADIISVSQSGGANELMLDAMIEAVRKGIIVVGGLGNDDGNSTDGDPAILNGAVSVLGAQSNGDLNLGVGDEPNTSEYVQVVGPGWEILSQGDDGDWTVQGPVSGTSVATPIVAGTLALAMQKYPDATGNQILQSMIHNTGGEGGEPFWDPTFGYGFVVPNTLLAADPTQYPDINPLLINMTREEAVSSETNPAYNELGQPERQPYIDEIYPDGIPTTPDATPTPTPTENSAGGSSSSNLGLIALLGGLGLLVLIVVAIVVAVARNKKT